MTIPEIKSRLTISQVLGHYGLIAHRDRLCCPWHNDKTPSLQIYPKTNSWTCFSSNCSAGSGDAIDFIQRMEKGTAHEAILKAKSLLGELPFTQPTTRLKTEPMINSQQELKSFFIKCCDSIRLSKSAQDYLRKRGLTKALEVGFNAGNYHLGQSELFCKSWMRAKLLKLGVKGTDYQVWAKRCLIFPLKNKKGEVVGVYGRSLLDTGKSKHFYQPNRQGLYPEYPAKTTKILILVESVIDAASLGQLDLGLEKYAVLALYGAKAFGEEHRRALQELNELEEIILMLDGDGAGEASSKKYAEELNALYPHVKLSRVALPDGEDVNSLHVNHGEESENLFQELISQRQSNQSKIAEVKTEISTIPLKESKTGSFLFQPTRLAGSTETLQIEVLGGVRLEGLDKLQVSLKVAAEGKRLRHRLDLYNDDQLEKLSRKCSEKLGVSTTESYQVLQQLTDALEKYRQDQLENKGQRNIDKMMSSAERKAAIEYLSAPELMKRSGVDLGKTGIIGEKANRLTMLLVMSSRKRQRPLHVMSLASSGQGKTHLQEGVAACIPEEDKLEMTSLSDNALYYFGREELKHKLILIEDLDGAENVLYPLRELQSKRKLSKTVALKDERGKTKTIRMEVEGPVCVAGCTTRERLYEDNANRSFLLYLDEGAEQDEKIMTYQRLKSAGKIKTSEEEAIRKLLQNTQRLLKDISVRNPFAEYLKIPREVFKPRRTHSHYLAFVEAITFYHQYQREIKKDQSSGEKYIETTLEDIRWANILLAPILLRKSDELTGACRSFFESLKSKVKESGTNHFKSKTIRHYFRLSSTTFYRYLSDLSRHGYLKIVGGNRYRQGYEYEIVSYTEYQELRQKISSVLDKVYEKLKNQCSTVPSVSHSENGTLKPL